MGNQQFPSIQFDFSNLKSVSQLSNTSLQNQIEDQTHYLNRIFKNSISLANDTARILRFFEIQCNTFLWYDQYLSKDCKLNPQDNMQKLLDKVYQYFGSKIFENNQYCGQAAIETGLKLTNQLSFLNYVRRQINIIKQQIDCNLEKLIKKKHQLHNDCEAINKIWKSKKCEINHLQKKVELTKKQSQKQIQRLYKNLKQSQQKIRDLQYNLRDINQNDFGQTSSFIENSLMIKLVNSKYNDKNGLQYLILSADQSTDHKSIQILGIKQMDDVIMKIMVQNKLSILQANYICSNSPEQKLNILNNLSQKAYLFFIKLKNRIIGIFQCPPIQYITYSLLLFSIQNQQPYTSCFHSLYTSFASSVTINKQFFSAIIPNKNKMKYIFQNDSFWIFIQKPNNSVDHSKFVGENSYFLNECQFKVFQLNVKHI